MVTLTLLATLAAAQVQGPLPKNAAIVYSGIPGIAGTATADVRMTAHNVTCELTKTNAAFSTLSLFRNDSAKPVTLTLRFPVNAQNPVLGRGWDIQFSATMNKAPVKLSPWKEEQTLKDDSVELRPGIVWTKTYRYKTATYTFKPKATYALRTAYSVPVGKSGMDGMQRLIAYETAGVASWKGTIDQFNFAVRYSPGVVFHVISASPDWGWQIGDRGGFFKQLGFGAQGDTLVRYMYYPDGYDKIGQLHS